MRNVQSDNKFDKFCVSKLSQNAARADAYASVRQRLVSTEIAMGIG